MTQLVVPSTDARCYPIYTQVANLQSLITANKNPALTAQYRQQLPALKAQLVQELMASGQVTPDNVLTSCTYGAADTSTY
jgi:hypothetical protein